MTLTVYGIPNCDSCRAARKWLTAAEMQHEFHDIRKNPVGADRVDDWLDAIGWERLLNRRGKAWREIPDEQRENIDANSARELLIAHPLLFKRPVMEHDSGIACGFSDASYSEILSGNR